MVIDRTTVFLTKIAQMMIRVYDSAADGTKQAAVNERARALTHLSAYDRNAIQHIIIAIKTAVE